MTLERLKQGKDETIAFLCDLQGMTQRRAVGEIVVAMKRHRLHRQGQEAACRALVELMPKVEGEQWH
jgi:hypothetical protein